MRSEERFRELAERYGRQVLVWSRGLEYQAKLREGSVAVIGCGALGSVAAELLVRAGVGRIKLVDRDVVEPVNLHRQLLFSEEDAKRRLPKAVAAAERLKRVNSEVEVEPLVVDVDSGNVVEVLEDVDVVVDGTDNLETRFLLNEACYKLGKPWVYGAVLRTYGTCMTIVPGETPCFRCLFPRIPPPGSLPTCDVAGVVNTVAPVIASIQAMEALKLLMGYEPEGGVLVCFDVWRVSFSKVKVRKRMDCPLCGKGVYEFLNRRRTRAAVLCGRDAVQITLDEPVKLDLKEMESRLSKVGKAVFNGYVLYFSDGRYEIVLFPDGRAIVKGVGDPGVAREVYSRYVGL